MTTRGVLLGVLFVTAACRGDKHSSPSLVVETRADLTGGREHAMRHCPNSVPGAITRMESTPGGLDLFVTAADADAAREIAARAHVSEQLGKPLGPSRHDSSHGGPGSVGYCPVIHVDTAVSVEDVPGGVRIHIDPLDPRALDELRAQVRERVDALALPSS
jgi:hypothetical protein